MAELEKLIRASVFAWLMTCSAASPRLSERAVTGAQRAELRRRLAEHRANPTEPVATLADIRREFSAD